MKGNAVDWPALETFELWIEALEWAHIQRSKGGPKYLVRRIPFPLEEDGKVYKWEAIQLWLRVF